MIRCLQSDSGDGAWKVCCEVVQCCRRGMCLIEEAKDVVDWTQFDIWLVRCCRSNPIHWKHLSLESSVAFLWLIAKRNRPIVREAFVWGMLAMAVSGARPSGRFWQQWTTKPWKTMVILPVNHAIVWGIVIEKVESTWVHQSNLEAWQQWARLETWQAKVASATWICACPPVREIAVSLAYRNSPKDGAEPTRAFWACLENPRDVYIDIIDYSLYRTSWIVTCFVFPLRHLKGMSASLQLKCLSTVFGEEIMEVSQAWLAMQTPATNQLKRLKKNVADEPRYVV